MRAKPCGLSISCLKCAPPDTARGGRRQANPSRHATVEREAWRDRRLAKSGVSPTRRARNREPKRLRANRAPGEAARAIPEDCGPARRARRQYRLRRPNASQRARNSARADARDRRGLRAQTAAKKRRPWRCADGRRTIADSMSTATEPLVPKSSALPAASASGESTPAISANRDGPAPESAIGFQQSSRPKRNNPCEGGSSELSLTPVPRPCSCWCCKDERRRRSLIAVRQTGSHERRRAPSRTPCATMRSPARNPGASAPATPKLKRRRAPPAIAASRSAASRSARPAPTIIGTSVATAILASAASPVMTMSDISPRHAPTEPLQASRPGMSGGLHWRDALTNFVSRCLNDAPRRQIRRQPPQRQISIADLFHCLQYPQPESLRLYRSSQSRSSESKPRSERQKTAEPTQDQKQRSQNAPHDIGGNTARISPSHVPRGLKPAPRPDR